MLILLKANIISVFSLGFFENDVCSRAQTYKDRAWGLSPRSHPNVDSCGKTQSLSNAKGSGSKTPSQQARIQPKSPTIVSLSQPKWPKRQTLRALDRSQPYWKTCPSRLWSVFFCKKKCRLRNASVFESSTLLDSWTSLFTATRPLGTPKRPPRCSVTTSIAGPELRLNRFRSVSPTAPGSLL